MELELTVRTRISAGEFSRERIFGYREIVPKHVTTQKCNYWI